VVPLVHGVRARLGFALGLVQQGLEATKLAFKPEPFELDDAKRFYVPGAVLTGACPKCGAT
jgi:hypothetical protein